MSLDMPPLDPQGVRRRAFAAGVALALPRLLSAQQVKPTLLTAGADREARAREWFTDTPLTDQDGKTHAFYGDLVSPRTVLINAAFVGCSSACPLLTQQLARTRDLFGARFGHQLWFLSITVDPLADGPAQLKEFAKRQGADGLGWRFLTGEPRQVEKVMRRIGLWPETPDAHQTTLIAGNARVGRWGKLRPDGTPQALAAQIERFVGPA